MPIAKKCSNFKKKSFVIPANFVVVETVSKDEKKGVEEVVIEQAPKEEAIEKKGKKSQKKDKKPKAEANVKAEENSSTEVAEAPSVETKEEKSEEATEKA